MKLGHVVLTAALAFRLSGQAALAQTQSNPAGTVGYTTTTTLSNPPCGSPAFYFQYSGWYFEDASGIKHNFDGSDTMCDHIPYASHDTTLTATSTDGLYTLNATGPTGVVTLTTAVQGLLYPKYVVVGVTYAPPGHESYATYQDFTSVGNTVSLSSSFSNDVGYSVSTKQSFGIPSGKTAADGSVILTYSSSSDYTEGQNSSSTTTLSKSTSVQYRTSGVPNDASPVNHDYDVIWLWMNPELTFNAIPATSGQLASIYWTGYAYDPNDVNGPDIAQIEVGCLNGDIDCGTSVSDILARSWVTGEQWPAGQGPGITPQDITNILESDPLAYNPGQPAYTLLDQSPLPVNTSDGRYTQCPYPPNLINYLPNTNILYNAVQTDTQSQSQGGSYQVKQSFGMSEQVSTGFFNIFNDTTTYTESDTLIWNYSWLDTLTTTTTETNGFSVTGPTVTPYNGPGQFMCYQDNRFGTFMFYPN